MSLTAVTSVTPTISILMAGRYASIVTGVRSVLLVLEAKKSTTTGLRNGFPAGIVAPPAHVNVVEVMDMS